MLALAVASAALAAPCAPPVDAVVLARSPAVVAYERDRRVVACSRRGRARLFRLGGRERVLATRVLGGQVATATGVPVGRVGRYTVLRVHRAADGRRFRQVGIPVPRGQGRVVRLALDRGGRVAYAWRATRHSGIYLANGAGHRPVDLRAGVALRSLHERGGRFAWRQQGRAREESFGAGLPVALGGCSIPRAAFVVHRGPVTAYELAVGDAYALRSTLWACLPGGEPRPLGRTTSFSELSATSTSASVVATSPPWVAVQRFSVTFKNSTSSVGTVDLRTGASGASGCAGDTSSTYERFVTLAVVVVTPSGRLGCSIENRDYGRAGDTVIETAGPEGRQELDRGPGVDARSLRLDGTTLRWRNGGAERSARLP